MKVSDVGETERTGDGLGAATLNVTVTVFGDPCTPVAAIVTWPV